MFTRSPFPLPFVVLVMTVAIGGSSAYTVNEYTLFMPNVRPKTTDLYLCTAAKIDPDAIQSSSSAYYIVGFQPIATSNTSHHMLLYGCSEPGGNGGNSRRRRRPVWNCGQMQTEAASAVTAPCRSGTSVLYGWARDAPALQLPAGVGFKMGGDSGMDYLVLQVHYRRAFGADEMDDSGVVLRYTDEPLPKLAGVYLLATDGEVPARAVERMETACPFLEIGKIVHPFAYRVHTHELGRSVAGYRVRAGDDGVQRWTLLGKRDPMRPQMFYPVADDNVTVEYGDTLAARCTMVSGRDTVTRVGPTGADEMCNFYVMYWMKAGAGRLQQDVCGREGPPLYYWEYDPCLNNVPDPDAL